MKINYNILFALIIVFAAYKLMQKIGLISTEGDDAAKKSYKQGLATDPNYWKKKARKTKKPPLTPKEVDRLATQIYEAKGAIYDDDEKAIAAIRELENKAQASFLTAYFSKKYNKDLVAFLSFLDDENKKIVFDYLNDLK